MSRPSVRHWSCVVPRDGSTDADCEDAAGIEDGRWPVCAAVADGATESMFAREWAERVVDGFVSSGAATATTFREALSDWQDQWRAAVAERLEGRPWYVSVKAAEGAFAAVLGLGLYADGHWSAVSVGDCCLFHVRDGVLEKCWPADGADDFTNRPVLLPSRSDASVPRPETATGTWRVNDRFLLATDAVAAWLMRSDDREPGRSPERGSTEGTPSASSAAPAAVGRLDPAGVRAAIETARAAGRMRNDDATLLVLTVTRPPGADDSRSEGA